MTRRVNLLIKAPEFPMQNQTNRRREGMAWAMQSQCDQSVRPKKVCVHETKFRNERWMNAPFRAVSVGQCFNGLKFGTGKTVSRYPCSFCNSSVARPVA
jgi:hypothetical protein